MPKKRQLMKSHVRAKDLNTHDAFKMGGEMYSILAAQEDSWGFVIVHARPIFGFLEQSIQMIVPKKTVFKVYNHTQ